MTWKRHSFHTLGIVLLVPHVIVECNPVFCLVPSEILSLMWPWRPWVVTRCLVPSDSHSLTLVHGLLSAVYQSPAFVNTKARDSDDDGDDVIVGHCLLLLQPSLVDTYSTDSCLLNMSTYLSHLEHLYIESGLYIDCVLGATGSWSPLYRCRLETGGWQ